MLTDTTLKSLKPKDKAYKKTDRDGMYIAVSLAGTISRHYEYRVNGHRESPTIGWYEAGQVIQGTTELAELDSGTDLSLRDAKALPACLYETIMASEVEALALGIVAWREEQGTVGDTIAVFRDRAFQNDIAKSKLPAILEKHGIKQVRSL